MKSMIDVLHRCKSLLAHRVYQYKYQRFIQIKEQTNGYLLPEAYKAIYTYALGAQEGNMVDIGPAQGGSSISIGLGIRNSRKASKVFTIEKCVASSALPSWSDRQLNAKVLKNNIEMYGLEDTCVLLVGDVKDVYTQVPDDKPLSLIFIDADGALDRDFELFYNRLLPGAAIIIDDYQDTINRFARGNYLTWTTEEEMQQYVESKGAERFLDLCPLGKEYTVYRFVNYFLERGLLTKDKVIGTTFFGYKPEKAVFDAEVHSQALLDIRKKIEAEYYDLREQLQQGTLTI